jgi:hypothetical protein
MLPERSISLHIGGLIANELDCTFSVQADLSDKPNVASIQVFGASEATRAAWSASAAGVEVRLQAGYRGQKLADIFRGKLRDINHKHEHAEWVTTISSGDGDEASATVAFNLSQGSSIQAAVARVARDLNLATKDNKTLAGITLANGAALFGKSMSELGRITAQYGMRPTIQSGELVVVQDGKALPGRFVDVTTGLVGAPEVTTTAVSVKGQPQKKKQRQLKITHLMTADIRPGYLLEVGTEGRWLVKQVTWSGSTFGNDWYVTALCVPPV